MNNQNKGNNEFRGKWSPCNLCYTTSTKHRPDCLNNEDVGKKILRILVDYAEPDTHPDVQQALRKATTLIQQLITDAYDKGFESGISIGHQAEAESRDRIKTLKEGGANEK